MVELIAVILILAILTAVTVGRAMPSKLQQLQAARDIVIASVFNAQEKALSQAKAVRVITTATAIDIRVDTNADGTFASNESITYGGTRYPYTIPNGVALTSNTINFDRLGRTTATSITLSKSSSNVVITITGMGYAY